MPHIRTNPTPNTLTSGSRNVARLRFCWFWHGSIPIGVGPRSKIVLYSLALWPATKFNFLTLWIRRRSSSAKRTGPIGLLSEQNWKNCVDDDAGNSGERALQAEQSAEIRNGSAVVRFFDRLGADGGVRYDVELRAGDAFPGNDRATAWVEVDGGPSLLLVTAYADDPLTEILLRQGFQLRVVDEPRKLSLGDLAGTSGIIINNVPASEFPAGFLAALDHFVNVQGGGLLMAGGKFSFGSGGYFESPIDPLLPVSMELREDHRTLSVAMAIVMDRSGSMSAGVSGGKTKMDLANEGAARSIELLGPRDAVTVFAVDSTAHTIVLLTALADGAAPIIDKVRRVQSMGGGIYVYEGLRAVAAAESMPRERELRKSVAPEPKTASADERRKRFERAKRGR